MSRTLEYSRKYKERWDLLKNQHTKDEDITGWAGWSDDRDWKSRNVIRFNVVIFGDLHKSEEPGEKNTVVDTRTKNKNKITNGTGRSPIKCQRSNSIL